MEQQVSYAMMIKQCRVLTSFNARVAKSIEQRWLADVGQTNNKNVELQSIWMLLGYIWIEADQYLDQGTNEVIW